MNSGIIRSLLILAAVVILLAVTPNLSMAQRECCEGNDWLKWNQDRQNSYVRGFIEGYYSGYLHACEEGTRKLSAAAGVKAEEKPATDYCLERKSAFSKGIALSKDVTRFYKRYPENRDLLINELLEDFGKGKSIEDIHAHPPFPYPRESGPVGGPARDLLN